jgi:hypothetical protein
MVSPAVERIAAARAGELKVVKLDIDGAAADRGALRRAEHPAARAPARRPGGRPHGRRGAGGGAQWLTSACARRAPARLEPG